MIVLDLCQLHYQNLLIICLEFFNSFECKSCIEKIKINSEFCFVVLKNNRLIYKCKEYREEWKRPTNNLYGWTMSQKLPVNGFKWVKQKKNYRNLMKIS